MLKVIQKCNINMQIQNFTLFCPSPSLGSGRPFGCDTENTLSDLELTAGNGKTTLVFKLLLSAIN